jgi:hypothetical protein
MHLEETVCEVVDWIHLPQDGVQWWALVNMVMNLRVLHDFQFLMYCIEYIRTNMSRNSAVFIFLL